MAFRTCHNNLVAAGEIRDELLDNIELITRTLYGMKEGSE
jgi:hypothetical protein